MRASWTYPYEWPWVDAIVRMLAPASYSAFMAARSDARRAPYSFTRSPAQVADLMDVNQEAKPSVGWGGPLIASLVGPLAYRPMHIGNRVDEVNCWLTR